MFIENEIMWQLIDLPDMLRMFKVYICGGIVLQTLFLELFGLINVCNFTIINDKLFSYKIENLDIHVYIYSCVLAFQYGGAFLCRKILDRVI